MDRPSEHFGLGVAVLIVIGLCVVAALAWFAAKVLVDYVGGG